MKEITFDTLFDEVNQETAEKCETAEKLNVLIDRSDIFGAQLTGIESDEEARDAILFAVRRIAAMDKIQTVTNETGSVKL